MKNLYSVLVLLSCVLLLSLNSVHCEDEIEDDASDWSDKADFDPEVPIETEESSLPSKKASQPKETVPVVQQPVVIPTQKPEPEPEPEICSIQHVLFNQITESLLNVVQEIRKFQTEARSKIAETEPKQQQQPSVQPVQSAAQPVQTAAAASGSGTEQLVGLLHSLQTMQQRLQAATSDGLSGSSGESSAQRPAAARPGLVEY